MNLKRVYLLYLSFMIAFTTQAHPHISVKDSITVYIFLHESCVISQYYTLSLKEMHEEYANEQLRFMGLFPNPSSSTEHIQAFKEKFELPFELTTDHFHTKKEALGASITPEVVVFNESKGEILYKGRIDDSYARVGQRKRVTSTSELKDVLEAVIHDETVLVANTEAVGCFIGKHKLDNHCKNDSK